MSVDELVQNAVRDALNSQSDLPDALARSISTKVAGNPLISQLDLSEDNRRSLAYEVANALYRIDLASLGVTNPEEIRQHIVGRVVDRFDSHVDHDKRLINESYKECQSSKISTCGGRKGSISASHAEKAQTDGSNELESDIIVAGQDEVSTPDSRGSSESIDDSKNIIDGDNPEEINKMDTAYDDGDNIDESSDREKIDQRKVPR